LGDSDVMQEESDAFEQAAAAFAEGLDIAAAATV
jgi:hypothetical protein